jgi:galactitol-specific phosphotransferase system IIC component
MGIILGIGLGIIAPSKFVSEISGIAAGAFVSLHECTVKLSINGMTRVL